MERLFRDRPLISSSVTIGRDGRVDECGGLESRCTVYGTGGSNPSLSETHDAKALTTIYKMNCVER